MNNKKYRIQKDLALLTLSMFIIVFLWVGSNIYDAYVTSTIDEVLQTQIIPIDGKFNKNTIERLKTRNKVLPDYTDASPSGDTQIEPTPESTEVSPTPSITQPPENTPFVTPENPDALL